MIKPKQGIKPLLKPQIRNKILDSPEAVSPFCVRKVISLLDMISFGTYKLEYWKSKVEVYALLCRIAAQDPDAPEQPLNCSEALRQLLMEASSLKSGNRNVSEEHLVKFDVLSEKLSQECKKFRLEQAEEAAMGLGLVTMEALSTNTDVHKPITYLEMATIFEGIESALNKDLEKITFVLVPHQKRECFEQKDLFGESVSKNFPSATGDIKAAGNCLALDLNTAVIFHLMRAVEIGLRALAKHLKVKIKKTPLEYAEWGTVLDRIEAKINEIKQRPRGPKKSADLEFYRGAWGEFSAFKDVWRNNVMHTRRSYDEHEAKSVYLHVQGFMQRLAVRISED